MLRALAVVTLAGLSFWSHKGVEHRYLIANGPDYVVVGRHEYLGFVHSHSCLRHKAKWWGRRLVVHVCEI